MAQWGLLAIAADFLDGDLPPQRWAVETPEPGADLTSSEHLNLAGPPDAASAEEPSDTAFRDSLIGEPVAFATEIVRGPDGKNETRRLVTSRRPPAPFGPEVRRQVCVTEKVPIIDGDGQLDVDRQGNPRFRDHIINRSVWHGRLSEFRLAYPDEAERRRRAQVGIVGGARRRLFALPDR